MAKYSQMAKKLQSAINQRAGDTKLIIDTKQWYSTDKDRPITTYVIKQSTKGDGKKKYRENIELFRTYSQIQMVLFLRDYWYRLNGIELPTDNEIWEEVKRQNEKQT